MVLQTSDPAVSSNSASSVSIRIFDTTREFSLIYLTPKCLIYLTPKCLIYLTPKCLIYLTPKCLIYLTPKCLIYLPQVSFPHVISCVLFNMIVLPTYWCVPYNESGTTKFTSSLYDVIAYQHLHILLLALAPHQPVACIICSVICRSNIWV